MRTVLLLAVACAIALSSCDWADARKVADEAVATFHERHNASHFAEIYDAADAELQADTSRDDFTSLLGSLKEKLGPKRSATRVAVNIVA